MKNIILLTLLMVPFISKTNDQRILKKSNFLGTTWAMKLKGDSYDYFWLSCDSTFTFYDDEIENRYYGKFDIKDDTLILHQLYEDDYHKYGAFPIKSKNLILEKFLILNDSTLLFISYGNVKAGPNLIYRLKQRFNCSSLDNH